MKNFSGSFEESGYSDVKSISCFLLSVLNPQLLEDLNMPLDITVQYRCCVCVTCKLKETFNSL